MAVELFISRSTVLTQYLTQLNQNTQSQALHFKCKRLWNGYFRLSSWRMNKYDPSTNDPMNLFGYDGKARKNAVPIIFINWNHIFYIVWILGSRRFSRRGKTRQAIELLKVKTIGCQIKIFQCIVYDEISACTNTIVFHLLYFYTQLAHKNSRKAKTI